MHSGLKEKAVFMIYLVISLAFLFSMSHAAYAQEQTPAEEEALATNACCEKTSSGDTCLYTRVEECDASGQIANFQYCEETPFCKVGCCVSEEEGSCSKQTSRGTCEAEGFKWYDSPACEVNECRKGCCVLSGASCAYVTENKCDRILEDYPELTKDFRESGSEIQCTSICLEQDRGCCVTEGGDECMWGTRGNCAMGDGTGGEGFYKDTYCSNENLPCDCNAQQGKRCLEGEEDVLWFDSCDNPEDIAEDCDYARKSSLCTEADDANSEAYCKSVNCIGTWDDPTSSDIRNGDARYNGESWCSYDAKTGPTFDVVGSRHYRHICINGEEMVEPCKDFREEMCISRTIVDDLISNTEYKNAVCSPNRWKECTTTCNTAKDAKDKEEMKIKMQADKRCCDRLDVRDCTWIGDENEGMCIPYIAPGLKFWTDTKSSATPDANAIAECEKGKYEAKAKWGKTLDPYSEWECKNNCDVYKDELLDSRNQFCRSLGDCGAHYNYIGGFSDTGFMRSWVKKPMGEPKNWVTKEMAGDFEEKWKDAGNALDFGKYSLKEYWGKFGGAAGYEGVIVGGAIASAVGISLAVTVIVAIASVTGPTSAAVLAAAASAAIPVAGWIISVAILLAAALVMILTAPKTEDRTVTFTCAPWQAPMGGDDCEKCDQPFKQCSEYRCRSLGSTCQFIKENEGTGRQTCYNAAPDDVSKPKMSPDEQVFKIISKRQDITDRFSIKRTQAGYEIAPEIPAFAKVIFGVTTDEPSQCYIDTDFKDPFKFSDLKLAFPDTYFSMGHNISYNSLLPDKEYKFYASCRDNNGNPKADEYIAPYIIELKTDNSPDLEPPFIIATEMPKLSKTPSHENETIIMVDVDEASDFECRISPEDRDFELMDMQMPCAHQPSESVLSAYSYCIAKWNVTEGMNTAYIRCKDNPSNSEPNPMTQSYVIAFEKSQPLTIAASGPSGDIYDRNITMFADTAAGAENGKAACFYIGTTGAGEFSVTNTTHSENIFHDLTANTYDFNVTCRDFVGNRAEAAVTFASKRDYDAPMIISLRKSGASVIMELDEPATCQYRNDTFAYGSGTPSAINSKSHSLSGQEKYYIICEDMFGNRMGGITIYPAMPKIERVKTLAKTPAPASTAKK